MTWLAILGLGAWVFILAMRVGDLKRDLQALQARLREQAAPQPLTPGEEVARAFAEAPLARPPGPEPMTEAGPERELARESVAAMLASSLERDARAASKEETFAPPPPRPAGPPPREVARAWIEENGLAWAGGAVLALGGLFLVTYAAQRGVFTPPLRLASAVLTGLVLLGASEWLLRTARGGPHRLPAAMSAGAGAATLYGAAWASYWLYSFIGLGPAGGLMGVISLGLLALAYRHGEPLAVLAIVGAFLAPAVTGPERWAAPALTGYLALITLTGFAVTAMRRWGYAGLATLGCAALWALAGFAAEGWARVAALAVAPVALALAAAEWRARRHGPRTPEEGFDPFDAMSPAALTIGAVLLILLGAAPVDPTAFAPAALGALTLAVLAALGARRRLIPGVLTPLGWLAAAAIAVPYLRAGDPAPPAIWSYALLVVLPAAGVAASWGRGAVERLWATGAAAATLAIALTMPEAPLSDGAAGSLAAVLLLAGAFAVARTSEAPAQDLAVAAWLWAAGGAAIFALQDGLDPGALPPALAALSLAGALAHARLGWRGFGAVMLAAAVATLGSLFQPGLLDLLYAGTLPWYAFATLVAGSVALVWGAAAVAGHRPDRPRESAEAQGTVALILGLTGVFILLGLWTTTGPAGAGGMDPLVEASVRSLLILTAGLSSAMAVREDSSWIGRWRGQALLLLGVGHVAALQVVAFNPLSAWWEPAVAGPPILDSLLLAYLGPALLLGAATLKKVSVRRSLLAVYAGSAGIFGLGWVLMETRRLFQGSSLVAGLDGVGRAEAAAYAVILLAAARAGLWLGEAAARRAWTISPLAAQAAQAARAGGWAALALAVLVFGYIASPWWGPMQRPLAGLRATALLLGLYATGAGVALWMVEPAARAGWDRLARASRAGVILIGFAVLNLVVRLGFRGYDMRPDARDDALETGVFSGVWGLYGFALLIAGLVRRSSDLRLAGLAMLLVTLAKIFLLDMARLDGVIRAGSFLVVGALLLAAAVLVRRLGGSSLPFIAKEKAREGPDGS